MRVTKTAVIQAASDIADEKGLNNVSLKVVAERLNIRTPSLYNHIENLDDLLREVAHNGMRTMNQRMAQVAIGKSGDTAIKAVAIEYLNYMIEHCGIYETIQWATWHGTDETAKIFCEYTDLLKTLILSCHFGTENAIYIKFHAKTSLSTIHIFQANSILSTIFLIFLQHQANSLLKGIAHVSLLVSAEKLGQLKYP